MSRRRPLRPATTTRPARARPIGAIFANDQGDRAAGNIVRLSVIDAEIASPWPPQTGERVVIWAELVAGEGEVAIGGEVGWSTPTHFGVRLGSLGVRESYAIVRAARRLEPRKESSTRARQTTR